MLHAPSAPLVLHSLHHAAIRGPIEPLRLVRVAPCGESFGMAVHAPGLALQAMTVTLQALALPNLVAIDTPGRLGRQAAGEQDGRAQRGDDETGEALHGVPPRREAA